MARGDILAVKLNFEKWPTYGLWVHPLDGGRGDFGRKIWILRSGWRGLSADGMANSCLWMQPGDGVRGGSKSLSTGNSNFSKVTDVERAVTTCSWMQPRDFARCISGFGLLTVGVVSQLTDVLGSAAARWRAGGISPARVFNFFQREIWILTANSGLTAEHLIFEGNFFSPDQSSDI